MVKSVRTTPEATDLQALFAVMREQAVAWCAMEVSSHALAMGRVDGARFAVAGFTNLTQDHLDFHNTFEEYFAAKASLFTPERCDVAVVTIDDEYGRRLAAQTVVPLVTVSTTGDADWTVANRHQSEHGTTVLDIQGPDETLTVEIGLPGDFNVANALLATAMLRQVDVPAEAIAAGLRTATVPGRMETFTREDGLAVIVDYAHTPDAVELALRAARTATKGRLFAIVGCGGDRDPGKRPGDGCRGGPGGGRRDRHRRQPAQRGPGGDPGRRARGRPAGGAGRRPARDRRPPAGDRDRDRAGRPGRHRRRTRQGP